MSSNIQGRESQDSPARMALLPSSDLIGPGTRIMIAIALEHAVPLRAIKSRVQAPHIVWARWNAWTAMREALGWSYPHIAAITGHDHSTVMHGIKKVQQMRQTGEKPAFLRRKAVPE